MGSAKVSVKLEEILLVMDSSNLQTIEKQLSIKKNQVAECILKTEKQIAFDISESISETGRFVLVDDYEIRGGGIIIESLHDSRSDLRDKVFLRNNKWIKSNIPPLLRAERYNQRSTLLLITGERNSERKEVARSLEAKLFSEGRTVYYLGFGNVLYGVDSDLESGENNTEHIRRLAEIAHIMLNAGIILIVSARELKQDDLEVIKTTVDSELIETIWVGNNVTTDIHFDLLLDNPNPISKSLEMIKEMLQEKGIIFKVW